MTFAQSMLLYNQEREREIKKGKVKTMTVKELMEELKRFDENAEVVIRDGDDEVTPNYIEDHEGIIVIQYIWF